MILGLIVVTLVILLLAGFGVYMLAVSLSPVWFERQRRLNAKIARFFGGDEFADAWEAKYPPWDPTHWTLWVGRVAGAIIVALALFVYAVVVRAIMLAN